MKTMTSNEIRKQIADKFNLTPEEVKCYHCKKWGYNRGCVMNSMGESACALRRGMADRRTASFQFCRGFDYVGKGK